MMTCGTNKSSKIQHKNKWETYIIKTQFRDLLTFWKVEEFYGTFSSCVAVV